MKAMNSEKAMKAIKKISLQKYLEKLVNAKMHKVTLFTMFPYSGAANLSDPHYFVLIDDIAKVAGLNSGEFLN